MPMRIWINEILNDGLIHYYTLFNQSELLLTSPAALTEVMVSKADDFIRPPSIRKPLTKILGSGILLAEGDEHKVSNVSCLVDLISADIQPIVPAENSSAAVCVPACQPLNPDFLVQITRNDRDALIVPRGREW